MWQKSSYFRILLLRLLLLFFYFPIVIGEQWPVNNTFVAHYIILFLVDSIYFVVFNWTKTSGFWIWVKRSVFYLDVYNGAFMLQFCFCPADVTAGQMILRMYSEHRFLQAKNLLGREEKKKNHFQWFGFTECILLGSCSEQLEMSVPDFRDVGIRPTEKRVIKFKFQLK